MKEVTSKRVTITPEKALEMLKINTRNRPMSQQTVLFYAEQMRNGNWQFNGESIIVSDGNVLLDGQHRLAAIVKSQTSQDVILVEGISFEAFKTIDTGKKRTAGHILSLEGVKNYNNISGILRAYLALSRNLSLTVDVSGKSGVSISSCATRPSNMDIYAEYQQNPALFQAINSEASQMRNRVKLFSISEAGAYMAYLILVKKHPSEKVIHFFRQVCFADSIDNESILTLRNKLLQSVTSLKTLTPKARRIAIIKSWNAYAQGKVIKVISFREGEDEPTFV